MTNNINISKSLSSSDAKLLATLSAQGKNIFTTPMAAEILKQPPAAVRKRLHRLTQKRWLQRLEKGKYLIVPLSAGVEGHYTENELVIAAQLIDPYYITYRTALSFFSYTEQPSRSIYLATTKRKSALSFHGLTYRFITLPTHKFFGLSKIWIGEHTVMMADREKTIVDGLDHPEHTGGIVEISKALWRGRTELDFERIVDYSLRMQNRAIVKRLGFLLECLDVGPPTLRESLQEYLSAGYAQLDTLSPKRGHHNARWRVLVNLPIDELLRWRET
jgi:predicted transcriptional regulator of viral defense system